MPNSNLPGLMSANGTASGFQYQTIWLTSGAQITINGGAILTISEDFATSGANWVISNATVNCSDDFYIRGATAILEEGSVTTAGDDWETQDLEGRMIVNGGMHSSGTATDNNIGSQGRAGSKEGCGIDFKGGIVTAGNFSFENYSVSSVSGTAILTSHSASTTFSNATGEINILSDWTGSWTVGSFSGNDWMNIVTNTSNGFRLDSDVIDAVSFADNFTVKDGGTKLALAGKRRTVIMIK